MTLFLLARPCSLIELLVGIRFNQVYWDFKEAMLGQTNVAFNDLCCCNSCVVENASPWTAAGNGGGQEEDYLLWKLWVVKRGLKDASRKDWRRDKDTR